MITIPQILLIIAAYFIYIIFLLVKQPTGSGNAGATNAARVLGKWGFISVFILDALKGFLPVFISYYLYGETVITLVVAAVVVLGHTYTVFLGSKGGKGVATGAGVFLALAPIEIGIALIVFIIVFLATKMVSAGSILGSLALLISVCIMSSWFALKVLTAVIVFFVILKHRSNIVRILKGEENRFVKKKEKDAE